MLMTTIPHAALTVGGHHECRRVPRNTPFQPAMAWNTNDAPSARKNTMKLWMTAASVSSGPRPSQSRPSGAA